MPKTHKKKCCKKFRHKGKACKDCPLMARLGKRQRKTLLAEHKAAYRHAKRRKKEAKEAKKARKMAAPE